MSDSRKGIMSWIWDPGGVIRQRMLVRLIKTGKDWKRTTVRTFISRLIDKGMLISQKEGRGALYIAQVSEAEYLKVQSVQFVNQVFGGNVSTLLTSLFGQQCLDKKKWKNWRNSGKKGREN